MIEEMYQQELKEAEGEEREERNQSSSNNNGNNLAQTPTTAATTSTEAAPPPSTTTTTLTTTTTTGAAAAAAGKRSQINASDSDPSLIAMNTQHFSESQPHHSSSGITTAPTAALAATSEVAPPSSQCYDSGLPPHRSMPADDTCRHGSLIAADYGTASGNSDIGSTLIRFGTTAGDVSLTLGLRHAGNIPEKAQAPPFSVRDFGGI